MNYKFIIILIFLLGCETNDEYRMRILQIDHSICANDYGLTKGTESYSNCRLQLNQLRLQQREIELKRSKILMEYGAYISRCGLAGELCR